MENKRVYEDTCTVVLPSTSRSPTSHQSQVPEGSRVPQYIAAFVATMGAFSAGTVMGWTSPTLPLLQEPGGVMLITPEQGSWVGCLMAVGALAGALPSGSFADRAGRKKAMGCLAVPLVISWVLIVLAHSVEMLYTARIFAGIGTGGMSVVVPMYVGEIASSSIRGTLGCLFQFQLTIGILFAYAVGAMVSYTWLAILCGVIPVLHFIAIFFIPETPQYLLSEGKITDATKSLQWLRGSKSIIQQEMKVLQTALQAARTNTLSETASLKFLFTDVASRRALIAALGLMLFQQLSGINAVIFYTVNIFEEAGSTLSPTVATIIVGVVQVGVTYAATVLVDKAGRKVLLLISSSIMAVCLGVLGLHFYLISVEVDMSSLGLIPLISVVLFIVVFSLGFGPIPWAMVGELFPSNVKGAASSLAVVENYVLVFIVTKTFQNLLDSLGSSLTFWLFAFICILGTIFVYFKVPETKGKTLEEIQLELAK